MEKENQEKIKKFLKDYCWNEILQLANEYPDVRSLHIDFLNLMKFNLKLANEFLEYPLETIAEAEAALHEIDLPSNLKIPRAKIRISNVPSKVQLKDLRSNHLNKLISVEGMVRKTTDTRPRIARAAFLCLRCGHTTYVDQSGTKFEEPFAGCEQETCGKKGPFKVMYADSTFVDSQKIQIQEPPEDLRGTQAQCLDIYLEDDLAGTVIPGERVIITGVLRSQQKNMRDGKSTYFDILLEANSIVKIGQAFDEIVITQEDEENILALAKDPLVYGKIVESIAPTIYGMEEVKEAMCLQLFSGVPKIAPDGGYSRGDIHILLCGDPSLGKSKLMKASQTRSPRATFASGKAATAGGLTAVVTRDEKFGEGRWTLEAGALVLADKGVAYIDEGDKMRPSDRDSLHEAMEQQTISLAKAGIIATLKTRTAVFMSANPKYGQFDKYENLADQISMPPSLLSRFDLIFLLLDTPNLAEDSKISEHLLHTHTAGEMSMQRKKSPGTISSKDLVQAYQHATPEISPELFRKYVAYARNNVFPVLSSEAAGHIHNFYLNLRKAGASSKKTIPITIRQEEAMIRLAEASARVRLSSEALLEDAQRATKLMMSCLRGVGVDPQTGELDATGWNGGVGKGQRETIKAIKELLKDRSGRYPAGKVPISDLVNAAEVKGISKDRVESYLKKIAQKGDIIMMGKDHVKLTV